MVHFFALLFWVAGGLASVAGLPQLGIAIFVVVVLNGAFAFAQEERAQHAADRLRQMLPRRATVLRDGVPQQIRADESWWWATWCCSPKATLYQPIPWWVVEQIQFKGGLVDRARRHGDRLASNDMAFIGRTGEVGGPVCGLGFVPPLVWTRGGQLAASGFPVFGDPFQPVPQARLESIDRFASGHPLYLGTDEPTIDVEIGLRDHGSLHRRVAMFA